MDHKVVQLSSLIFIVVVVKPIQSLCLDGHFRLGEAMLTTVIPFPPPPPSLIVSIFALAEQEPELGFNPSLLI